MIKIKKYLFSVILFLLLVQYNVFSNGREYGNLFYSLSVPGSDNYDYYYGEWDEPKSRVLIDKKGNKILNLLFNEDAEILKDLYTDEPKLLIKFSLYRNLNYSSDINNTNKIVANYNPIYEYARENLIEMSAPYWWYHEDVYKYNGYDATIGTKIKVYDLNGNDLNIEFQTLKEVPEVIWVLGDIILYVNHDLDGDLMYYYNLTTKEKKKLGYYEKVDITEDKIIAYKANQNERYSKYDKSAVAFFTKKMELIKEFDGYAKIDYVKISGKDYYVLTYNKLVYNKVKRDMLGDDNGNYNCRRYANFVDENLNLVFGKDILIDYEDIKYDFNYEKVFNDNVTNNNTILGPHNNLIDINDINLIIELKNEILYMICDKKGYAICDENKNIIGNYFDKPIYIHNIADIREKLIFSYAKDEISHFLQYWNDDYEDLFYDNLDIDALKKKTGNYEFKIHETKLDRQYFHIKDNKIEYLKNIDDMALVALNIDGFYFYHKIYGNNGLTYLRRTKNDLEVYENKIYDLDGNVYDVKIGLPYLTNIYQISNEYYIFPMSSVQYQYDYDVEVYDFHGDKVLDLGNYKVQDGNLLKTKEDSVLYLYDAEFKEKKQIDIYNCDVEFKNNTILIQNRKTKEKRVYDKNFDAVKDINSLPYNFINLKQTYSPYAISSETKMITSNPIEFKTSEYGIQKSDNGKYGLRDYKNKKTIVSNYRYLEFFNDKYVVYQYGFKFGLMDYVGNKFCEFSIFNVDGTWGEFE